jgi:hypothetical protein
MREEDREREEKRRENSKMSLNIRPRIETLTRTRRSGVYNGPAGLSEGFGVEGGGGGDNRFLYH